MKFNLFKWAIVTSFFAPCAALSVCPQKLENIFSSIYFLKTEPDCQFLEEVLEPLQHVSEFFQIKKSLFLFVRERGINASYDHGEIIWIPKELYAYSEKSQTVIATKTSLAPILLHEIGHTFLHERFKKEFSQDFGDLFHQFEKVSENTLINALAEKPSMSSRRFGSHLSETDVFKKYQEYLVGYAELYADAVSVFYFNDPEVMFKSLEFATHTEFERQLIQLRKFSQDHRKALQEPVFGPHGEFALVRSFLGEQLKSYQEPQGRLRLLKVLEEAIIKSASNELLQQKLTDTLTRNENLISHIQIELQK